MAPTTSGSASSDIIAPAVKNERPNTDPPAEVCERNARKGRENINRPKIASTTLGAPAIISMPDSTARASPAGRPYSPSHTATATPSGPAIRMPSAASSSVPRSGPETHPSCLRAPTPGEVNSRLGRT